MKRQRNIVGARIGVRIKFILKEILLSLFNQNALQIRISTGSEIK
jgi:hypothetical protein